MLEARRIGCVVCSPFQVRQQGAALRLTPFRFAHDSRPFATKPEAAITCLMLNLELNVLTIENVQVLKLRFNDDSCTARGRPTVFKLLVAEAENTFCAASSVQIAHLSRAFISMCSVFDHLFYKYRANRCIDS